MRRPFKIGISLKGRLQMAKNVNLVFKYLDRSSGMSSACGVSGA